MDAGKNNHLKSFNLSSRQSYTIILSMKTTEIEKTHLEAYNGPLENLSSKASTCLLIPVHFSRVFYWILFIFSTPEKVFVRKNPEVIFSKVPKQWWPNSDIPIGSTKLVPVVVKPRWTRIFFGRLFSEAVLETEVPQMMSVFKVKRQIVCNKPGKVAWNLKYHLIEKEDNLPNLHVDFPRCISMVSQEYL